MRGGPEESEFTIHQKVRVRMPRPGSPHHTYDGRKFQTECQPGDLGTVYGGPHLDRYGVEYVSVKWESGRSSNIDTSCLKLVDMEGRDIAMKIDDEIATLFGLNPPKHCETCTCTPVERAKK